MIYELAKLRGQIAEDNIRKKINDGIYLVSYHAQQRMAEREIEIEKVIECILEGERIEDQIGNEDNDFKVLFQEGNSERPEVYTVVADRDTPVIVTVCRTKDEVWECVGNLLKRREKHK